MRATRELGDLFMSWIEGISERGVFMAGMAVMLLAILGASVIVRKVAPILRKYLGGHYPGKSDAKSSQQIYNELVETRALTSADRAFVMRFHNGMEFLPSSPVWKLTCTHEFAKHGVRYAAGEYQSILASRMIKIVGTLLTGESDDPGVRMTRECSICENAKICEGGNRRMIVVQADEMAAGFEKFTLGEQNVKTALVCGMTYEGQVVGVVVLHFCDAKLYDEEGLGSAIKTLCEASERIQYLLGNKSL